MSAANGKAKKTLVRALHDKYSIDEDTEIKIHVRIPKGAPGYSEEGKLIVPQHLALNCCNITDAGEDAELEDLCSTVCELDLADNTILEWTQVFKILLHCPHVTFLNLSKNQLKNSTSTVTEAVKGLELPLEKLVLNDLQLEWTVIWQLLNALPKVYELHLSLNEYSQVTMEASKTFPSITTLHINGNKFSDWSEIAKLGQLFPNLQTLVMMENPIATIDTSSVQESFPSLVCVNISKTELRDWIEVEKLRSFPALTEVRLSSIRFMENLEQKPRRQRVIAYLPNIERLNGSPVGVTEREDAERAFIRLYLDREDKPQRCLELEAVHGKLDALVDVNLSDKSDMAQVLVVFEGKSKLLNIDTKQTVAEFKKKHLSELTGLHPRQFRIFRRDVGAPYDDEEMIYSTRPLYRAKVKTGDEIHVYPK